MIRREFLQSLSAAGAGSLLLPKYLFSSVEEIEKVYDAASAREFVDSIGVATHWTYPDTPYGYAYSQVLDLLVDSGIRHVRDGFSNRIQELGEYGIQSTVGADLPNYSSGTRTNIQGIRDRIKAENENGFYVDTVEGPNEPDLFWERFQKTYDGNGFEGGQEGIIKGVVQFQKDLFEIIKCDSETEKLIVIGIALGKTYDPGGGSPNPFLDGELADFVDWGNFHPYPYGGNPFSYPAPYAGIEKYYWQSNFPSINMDEYPFALNTYAPPYAPKPMASTETGYPSHANGVSERTHGKYIPRLYAEYFRLGIKRMYIYEFIDEFKDPDKTNPEANFGLVRRDLTPKPGYVALQSLIDLLQDNGPDFEPGGLAYRLRRRSVDDYSQVKFVHHLLLQKSDGVFYMLLWHEISAEDVSYNPHKQLEHPEMPVELLFEEPISDVTLYRYDADMQFVSEHIQLEESTAKFTVPDQIVVAKITIDAAKVQEDQKPGSFSLQQNYPNPFNPVTTINYSLQENASVVLEVFDARGRSIETLVNEYQQAGQYHINYSNNKLPSGSYFYKLNADGVSSVRKMSLVR